MEQEKTKNKDIIEDLISERCFEEIPIATRNELIHFVYKVKELRNARKYSSKNKSRKTSLWFQLTGFLTKGFAVSMSATIITLLLGVVASWGKLPVIDIISGITASFFIVSMIFFMPLVVCLGILDKFKKETFDYATETYKNINLSTLDFIFEVFKTNNEKDNDYIKSVILQEVYKVMKEVDESQDLSILMRRVSHFLILKIDDIINSEYLENNPKKDFLMKILENVDNRLDKLN